MNFLDLKSQLVNQTLVIGNPLPHHMLVIRVNEKGMVTPSKALIEKFDLEFKPKGHEGSAGNGLDIFATSLLKTFNVVNSKIPNTVAVAISPKSSPALDLFKSVSYDSDGNPKSLVADGITCKGGQILWLVAKKIFGKMDPEFVKNMTEAGFIDLEIIPTCAYSGEVKAPKFDIVEGALKAKSKPFSRASADIHFLVPFTGEYGQQIEEEESSPVVAEKPKAKEIVKDPEDVKKVLAKEENNGFENDGFEEDEFFEEEEAESSTSTEEVPNIKPQPGSLSDITAEDIAKAGAVKVEDENGEVGNAKTKEVPPASTGVSKAVKNEESKEESEDDGFDDFLNEEFGDE